MALISVFAAPADFDKTFGVNGSVTTQIGTSGYAVSLSVVTQPDGKIIAVGYHMSGVLFAESDIAVVRYNADGTLDSSFGSGGIVVMDSCGGTDSASDAALQPDGKIVVVGACHTTNTSGTKFAVLRYNTNGSLDSSFGTNGKALTPVHHIVNAARAVALQPDGKIVVAGTTSIGEGGKFAVVRYNSTGTLDTSFDGDGKLVDGVEGDAHAYGIAVQPDGKVLVAGYTSINEDYEPNSYTVVRYHADGSRDGSFGTNGKVVRTFNNGNDQATEVLAQPDGKILLGGYATRNAINDFTKDFAAARLLPDGSPDTTFGTGGKIIIPLSNNNNEVKSMLLQPNGKIILAGSILSSSNGLSGIVRLQPDGSPDRTFGVDGRFLMPDAGIRAAILQSNGRIVIAGGNFNLWRLLGRNTVADYDSDGKADISVFRPSNGTWYRINTSNGQFSATQFGASGDIPVPADYDGDGETNYAVARNENGRKVWYVLSTNGTFYSIEWGFANDQAAIGDFDRDGRADLVAIRQTANGLAWYVRQSSDGALKAFQFGANFDKPVFGDFDGDSATDVAVTRSTPQGLVWHILKSGFDLSYSQYAGVQFGINTDLRAVEDFDGDSVTDIAVFRPENGAWYILRSLDNQFQSVHFGTADDVPQPGDYNGDGKAEPIVFRPSTGTWFVARPTGAPAQNFDVIQWGASGDTPVLSIANP